MNTSLLDNSITRYVERLAALFGRRLGSLLLFRNPGGLFFFFPFCHIGGAERVHSNIVNCLADRRPWVFFTKWSPRPSALLSTFEKAARTFNWTLRLKYTYPLSAGLMAGFINRHPNAVVFGCNTLFFYKMLPYLAPHVRKVDLLHAFGGGAEDFSLPVVSQLDARVVINARTRVDLASQYCNKGIELKLIERVMLIENCVRIPDSLPEKSRDGILNILYVGRASEEKRVHLVGKVAALCAERELPVKVTLVGDIPRESMHETSLKACTLAGEIHDPVEMERLYSQAHMLLVTSSREGFPMVIMEAMAHGVVPLSTDVGGIPEHLKSGENGWLIENHGDESLIVEDVCSIIAKACSDRHRLDKMANSAYGYASANFSPNRFCKAYRRLLAADGDPAHA